MQPLSSSACLLKRSITASLQRLSRLLCYGLCGGFAWAHAGIVVSDDLGTRLRLERPAQRIITLAPHLTETLFAAGAGERLIGAVAFSDYPEAAKKAASVGGYSQLDLEAITALKPDLIIAWHSGNAPANVEKLRGFGFPIYVSQPNSIEDVASEIERMGRLAGTSSAADAPARQFRVRLAALRRENNQKPVVRTFYQI